MPKSLVKDPQTKPPLVAVVALSQSKLFVVMVIPLKIILPSTTSRFLRMKRHSPKLTATNPCYLTAEQQGTAS